MEWIPADHDSFRERKLWNFLHVIYAPTVRKHGKDESLFARFTAK